MKYSKVESIETEETDSYPIYHLSLSCGHVKTITRRGNDPRDYRNAPTSTRQKCKTCHPVDLSAPKTCSDCKEEKPRTEFYKSKSNSDGLVKRCKDCHKEYQKAHRSPRLISEYSKTYRQVYKKKVKAKNLAREAMLKGLITRPDVCEECHAECTPHAHHDDYNYPLKVRWLCKPCHAHWHNIYGEAKNGSEDINDRYIEGPALVEALQEAANDAPEVVEMIAQKLDLAI